MMPSKQECHEKNWKVGLEKELDEKNGREEKDRGKGREEEHLTSHGRPYTYKAQSRTKMRDVKQRCTATMRNRP